MLLNWKMTVRDVIYDAANAYINALVAEAQLQLAIADTVSKSTLLNTSRQMYEEGRLLLTSLNQVIADRNEVLNNLEKARDIYVNNVQQLLLALGMEPDLTVQLQLTDNVDQLLLGERPDFELRTDGLAYRKQMRNDELLQTQIRTSLKGHLPTVQLKGYYGGNYFDNNLDLLQSNNWYGNSYVSLGIRLPLTEGIERHEKVAQLRLKQQSGLLRYQHEEQKNRLEHMNALMEVRTFERNLERVRENFQLAEQNLRLAEQQFSNGRLSLSDMHQAGYVYQLEKNKYLNFVYDYLAAMLKAEWIHSR